MVLHGPWIMGAAIAICCFIVSGERQSRRLRREFFTAILAQEVGRCLRSNAWLHLWMVVVVYKCSREQFTRNGKKIRLPGLCACGRGKAQHLVLHSWTSSGMNGLQSARNNLHTPGPHTVHTDGNSLLQREVVCAIHTDVAVASCTHPRAVSDTSLTHGTVLRVVCERVGQLEESLLGFWVEAARPLPLWAGFRRKTSTLSDLPKIQLHAVHGCKF